MRLFCFILTCLSSNMHGFCRVKGLEKRRRQRAVFTVQNREFHREHIDSSCFRKLDRFSVAMHMELWMSSRIAPKVTRGRSVSTTCFRVHRIKKAKFGSSSQGVYPLHGMCTSLRWCAAVETLTPRGIEPRIFGSVDRRLIHWAMEPRA